MVSQFVSSHDVPLLGALDFPFPEGTHAIGRLDQHSEGLLLLTTNKTITRKLFQGAVPHTRQYLVKVKKIISENALHRLRTGVPIIVKGGEVYITMGCSVEVIHDFSRFDVIKEVEQSYPLHSWILITLVEGKYHQVRKMVRIVGHKCLRLIRVAIEDIKLEDLPPGGVMEMEEDRFFSLLNLD